MSEHYFGKEAAANAEATVLEGSCHCGAVSFQVTQQPEWLTECNCSICRRLGALWFHIEEKNFRLEPSSGATTAYSYGERNLAVHSCAVCACTTHWENLKPEPPVRMAVNFRLCPPEEIAKYKVRHFDGADSWEFLD